MNNIHPRHVRRSLTLLVLTTFVFAVGLSRASSAPRILIATSGTITRVSVASNGDQADSGGGTPAISADGRWVAFASRASNLVSNDTNGKSDIFVHDRVTLITTRVSVTSNGSQTNADSGLPGISADGRYVVFNSHANNLVSGDTKALPDIFVHDRVAQTTTRVSVATDGTQTDQQTYETTISADGRWVTFVSRATNLVSGDTNLDLDIFAHDQTTHTTTRVSVSTNGVQADGSSVEPSLSGDGRYVAFFSVATNLVISDTNAKEDVFVRDRLLNTTTRVSVASNGSQANSGSTSSMLSADGRYVAFMSEASNLVIGDTNSANDIFIHDQVNNSTIRISVADNGTQANDQSLLPRFSGDGRYVAFFSEATNLVSGDTNDAADVFVYDQTMQTTARIPAATDTSQLTGIAHQIALSANGHAVAFSSEAITLVNDDTNNLADVFVYEGIITVPVYLPLVTR